MEFISAAAASQSPIWLLIPAGFLLIAMVAFVCQWHLIGLNSFVLIFVSIITLLIVNPGVDPTAAKTIEDNRIQAIYETYGLELTSEELKSLSYPKTEPSKNEIIEYGNFDKAFINNEVDELDSKVIKLVWVKNELQIFESATNDELGTELARSQ